MTYNENTRAGGQSDTGEKKIVEDRKDRGLPDTIQDNAGNYLDIALQYHSKGLRVIPFWNDPDPKKQFPKWSKFRTSQSVEDVEKLFSRPCDRIAIITGIDGLEAIDIDTKHDNLKSIATEFGDLCKEDEDATKALEKCLKVRTKSGGWHIIYRSSNIEGNQKLTTRKGAKEAVIETRGIGGLLFVAPSPGYVLMQGSYLDIPQITETERTALISIAKLLSYFEEDVYKGHGSEFERPGDVFNSENNVLDLALKYGWRVVSTGSGKTYLNRPGAKNTTAVDATILETKNGQRFYPFTTSSRYIPNKCYSAFGMFAVEEFRGDYAEAAKFLREKGGAKGQGKRIKICPEVIKVPTFQAKTICHGEGTKSGFWFDYSP